MGLDPGPRRDRAARGAAGSAPVPGPRLAPGGSGFPGFPGTFGTAGRWAAAAAIAVTIFTAAGWFFDPLRDLLVLGPVIAAVGCGPVPTAWIAAYTLFCTLLPGPVRPEWLSEAHWIEIVEVALTGSVAVFFASVRRRGERRMWDGERQFRAVFDEALDAIVLIDNKMRFVDANPAACALFGRTREDFLRLSVADISPPERDVAGTWSRLQSAGKLQGEWTVLRPDGTARQIEFSATAHIVPGRHLALIRDVTDRKKAEEALRGSEERFRAVFEGAGDALLIFDEEARFVDVNAAARELYGRPREELLGRRMEDLRTSTYKFQEKWEEFLRLGSARGELRVPRPDGTVRDVEYAATARFLPGRHLTIQRDVTERRRAERRERVFSELGLKLSSAQTAPEAAKVIAGCADELCPWDACAVDLYFEDSNRVDPILMMDTINGERVGVGPARVHAPPTPRHRGVLREGAQILLREEPVTESDSVPFGDTTRLSRSILTAPIRAGASVVGFISVQSYKPKAYDERDLESLQILADHCGGAFVRTRAFEWLRRSEQKLREAQAIGRIGIWERDLQDDSVIWSNEMYEFFGLDPEHFRPTPEAFYERIHPEDRVAVHRVRQEALQSHRPFRQEFRIRKADGSVAVIQSRAEVMLGETGQPVRIVGVSQEVTEQRRTEEDLRRSSEQLRALAQRLGAVREEESARIARAVHDEVGQALTALKLDLSWVGKRLTGTGQGEDADVKPKLAAMETLIDETLDAVQRISTELRPGVLHELGLEAAVGWYSREFQKRTEIACRFHSDLAGASLDGDRSTAAFRILQEILTNVVRHAGATEVEISLGRENGSLVLEARDNGKGISDARIADASSLGLVGMRERAHSFGGSVGILTRSGGGTTVTVRIPL